MIPDNVSEFLRELQGNGKPLELKKHTEDGEILYVSLRHFHSPLSELGKAGTSLRSSAAYIINLYAEGLDGTTPVGHNDWLIENGTATNRINLHGITTPTNYREALSKERWEDSLAVLPFCVDHRYQHQGLGTFLAATSLLLMENAGQDAISVSNPTKAGRAVWGKFGVDWKTTPLVSTHQLATHSLVEKTIREFIS